MLKLTLYVSKVTLKPGLRVSELVVRNSKGKEGRPDLSDGAKFDPRSRKSIDGIFFLIIKTYLARKSRQGDLQEPFIPKTAPKYLTFLKTLFDTKSPDTKNWQEDLFGDNPFYPPEHFLERRGSRPSGTAEPYLMPNVEVDIQPTDPLLKFNDQNLEDLAECLAAGVVSNPAKLSVTIKGNDFEIRSSNRLGSLSLNDRVRVLVHWNYRCEHYVFWINCENKVVSLYPKNEVSEEQAEPITDDKGQRTLKIPPNEQMQILAAPGHEVCMICSSRESLTPRQVSELKKQIVAALEDGEHDGTVQLAEADFREYSWSPQKKRLLRRRLGRVQNPEGWESNLVQVIKDLVQKVALFYIPNRE